MAKTHTGNTPKALGAVAAELSSRYMDFNHHNLRRPLDELLFIICSTRTTEQNYRDTYASLRKTFRTKQALMLATIPEIAAAIKRGGLSNKKASQIRRILLLFRGDTELFHRKMFRFRV